MLELELPYPPSVNSYKRVGRTVMTKKGKIYQQRVNTAKTNLFYYEVWVIIKNLKAIKRISMPIDSTIDLCLSVDAYFPDKRVRDLDNILKALLDSLVKGGLIKDDSQIKKLLITRCGIERPKGKIIIRISEYEK